MRATLNLLLKSVGQERRQLWGWPSWESSVVPGPSLGSFETEDLENLWNVAGCVWEEDYLCPDVSELKDLTREVVITANCGSTPDETCIRETNREFNKWTGDCMERMRSAGEEQNDPEKFEVLCNGMESVYQMSLDEQWDVMKNLNEEDFAWFFEAMGEFIEDFFDQCGFSCAFDFKTEGCNLSDNRCRLTYGETCLNP